MSLSHFFFSLAWADDASEIMEIFEKLDNDKSGTIEKSDLRAHYQLSIAPGLVHTQ